MDGGVDDDRTRGDGFNEFEKFDLFEKFNDPLLTLLTSGDFPISPRIGETAGLDAGEWMEADEVERKGVIGPCTEAKGGTDKN